VGAVTYPTLEHVAMQARPYPAHLLEGCETGLCLFAAAFLGHNDAIHMAEAGLRVTCVDTDALRLHEMMSLYPSDWQFITADAWSFAHDQGAEHRDTLTYRHWAAAPGIPIRWDVVSVDTFTGDAMQRSLESLPLWCSLARKAATVTHTDGASYQTPAGWRSSLVERATGVNWLVLERMGAC
jgi:hypothetical protein